MSESSANKTIISKRQKYGLGVIVVIGLTFFLLSSSYPIFLNVCYGLIFGTGALLIITIRQNQLKQKRGSISESKPNDSDTKLGDSKQ